LRFIGRLAKFANLEGYDYDNPQYGEAMKANTAFGAAAGNQGQSQTTTITISSKLNTMDDDDEPFGLGGEPAPF
jgi:hypothetical protein